MPTINLKPNSPEYMDRDYERIRDLKQCDMEGCANAAEYKAPKNKELNQYYHFCFEHVREYNEAWNYLNGMSPEEINENIWRTHIWDRPTWKPKDYADLEEKLREKVVHSYFFGDGYNNSGKTGSGHKSHDFSSTFKEDTPEAHALRILELSPPVNLCTLKQRYKTLVKQYHPDVVGSNKETEERMKNINMAYTILKVAYKKFENLTEAD